LKAIIRELRSKNVEDPEVIAAEFAIYRAKFIKIADGLENRIINNIR